MKKRLLALALCLVMMTSLLPLTAAAASKLNSLTIEASGVEQKDDGFYHVKYTRCKQNNDDWQNDIYSTVSVIYTTKFTNKLTDFPVEQRKYYVQFFYDMGTDWQANYSLAHNFDATLNVPGYTADMLSPPQKFENGILVSFELTKTEHTWQFKQAGNTLTGKCRSCNIDPVTLTLSASSVTLPESPFNAKLETTGAVKDVLSYGDIQYQYKDPTDGWINIDDPKTFTPKPGEYQAGVPVYGFPRDFVYEGGELNQNNEAYLWVKYTAVDPAVTAQTGDNRPIELMLGSVVVFSALAAAAFIADSKRKYSR